jgi:hypothetical protein
MMQGHVFDYPTRLLVHSESERDESYLVDLCAYPRGKNAEGFQIYNGSCLCRHFLFNLEPKLKDPQYDGKIFRCKHQKWARENVLDYLLPVMHKADTNHDESIQT